MKFKPEILVIVFLLVNLEINAYGYTKQAKMIQNVALTYPKTVKVDIKLFTFKPGSVEVPVGTTVVWINSDAIEHSVTHGTPEKQGVAFDSGSFTKGKRFSFTFTKVGEYPYFCKRHNSMQGKIKVVPNNKIKDHKKFL